MEPWCDQFFRAWQALRFDRPLGSLGGQGHIPFQSIDVYARRYGFEGDTFETLLTCVRALDDVWLEHVAEQMKKQEKPP